MSEEAKERTPEEELRRNTEILETSLFYLKESLMACADAVNLVAETIKRQSKGKDLN